MNSFARAEISRNLSQPTKDALAAFIEQRIDCLVELTERGTSDQVERHHDAFIDELAEVLGTKRAVDAHLGGVER